MVTSESENPADGAPDDDELSNKLARLSDEKRQKYENQITVAKEQHGTLSREYQLGLANTYLQGLPPEAEKIQVKDHSRREQERAFRRDQRNARNGASPAPNNRQPETTLQPAPEPTPSNPPQVHARDYTALQRAHEQAAGGKSDSQLLSKEQLEEMAGRFAEVRKADGLEPTPAELRERNDQIKSQSIARDNLDRTASSAPESEQKEQRALLDRQHLAELVSIEGRQIAEQLRRRQMPGAESYEHDARNANHTAYRVHDARKNLGADRDRTQETSRTLQQQDQHRQSTAQEALRGGVTLTSEQMANMPSNVKEAVTQKERAESDRNLVGGAHNQITKPGASKPGNTRGGGR